MHYFVNIIFKGFYDTSMEQFEHLEPNFKRLRQQHLDGELRRSVNYIQREHTFRNSTELLLICMYL